MSKKYVSKCLADLRGLNELILEDKVTSKEFLEYFSDCIVEPNVMRKLIEDWTEDAIVYYYKKHWEDGFLVYAFEKLYFELLYAIDCGKISKERFHEEFFCKRTLGYNYVVHAYKDAKLFKESCSKINLYFDSEEVVWNYCKTLTALLETQTISLEEYKLYFTNELVDLGSGQYYYYNILSSGMLKLGNLNNVKLTDLEKRMLGLEKG